ncbi:MAG: hypothetical protein WBI82_01770 [Sphaerochaeta sp.]
MNKKLPDLDIQEQSQARTSKKTSPIKVIRNHCLTCCCGSTKEVKLCPAIECDLHPYRFGKNPFRKPRVLTETQRQEMATRLHGGN